MARRLGALTVILMLGSVPTASAQSLRVSQAMIATSMTLDNVTTNMGNHPRNEVNPLLPDHRGWNAAAQAGATAGVLVLTEKYGRQHPKLLRATTWILVGVGAIDSWNNLRVRSNVLRKQRGGVR